LHGKKLVFTLSKMCENAKLHSKSTKSIHEATIEKKQIGIINAENYADFEFVYMDFKKCCEKC
jgi:hypothetical protein